MTRPHFACGGAKKRARTCTRCGGTGEALVAFRRALKRLGFSPELERPSRAGIADVDQDRVVDEFAAVCHGEDTRQAERVVAVLQHCLDRAAFDTIWRLGDLASVFEWLSEQERQHCAFDEEEPYDPGT